MGRALVAAIILVPCAIAVACGDATFSGSQDGGDSGADASSDVGAPDSSADGGAKDAQLDGEVSLFGEPFGAACSPWTGHNATLTDVMPDGGPRSCEVCATADNGYAVVNVPLDAASGTFVYTTLMAADPVTDDGGLFYWSDYMQINFADPDAATYFPSQQGTSSADFSAAQVTTTATGVASVNLIVNGGGGTPTGECFLFADPRLVFIPSP